MFGDQGAWPIRCEWGLAGVEHLRASSDVIVIVDVLSFSTCVEIAVSRGARVHPYRWRDATAATYAEEHSAILAEPQRSRTAISLSPTSLLGVPHGARLVLPSPNGATLSLATGAVPTLAGCLPNARAVAAAARTIGSRITVVPAGEHWPDGRLRPAIEDLIGAGAIIHYLQGTRSPEATIAEHAFRAALPTLGDLIHGCSSGRELIEQGFADDVALAAALNSSDAVPLLRADAYEQMP